MDDLLIPALCNRVGVTEWKVSCRKTLDLAECSSLLWWCRTGTEGLQVTWHDISPERQNKLCLWSPWLILVSFSCLQVHCLSLSLMEGWRRRWMVEGPKRQRGTQNYQSVLPHPAPRPMPRSQPRPQAPHLRVLLRTPSQRSTCPCSKSKSWPTRSAQTRGPRPWTGPRKMNSSATYRAPPLTSLTQIL